VPTFLADSCPCASIRVEPASRLTQSRTAAVCGALRNSPASDSMTFFGGRFPPTSGTAPPVLLLMSPTVTWLSR
jgi:hypothetical protein